MNQRRRRGSGTSPLAPFSPCNGVNEGTTPKRRDLGVGTFCWSLQWQNWRTLALGGNSAAIFRANTTDQSLFSMDSEINESLGGSAPTGPGGSRGVSPCGQGPNGDHGDVFALPFTIAYCCRCSGTFTKPGEVQRHYAATHPTVPVSFVCARCKTSFQKAHGAVCHIPKCKGEVDSVEGQFKCPYCPRSFVSQRGLSTHKRIRHLQEQVDERQAALGIAEPEPAPTPNTTGETELWTAEEMKILVEMEERYASSRNINLLIASHLPRKTNKQVSNKRAQLRIRRVDTGEAGDPSGRDRPSQNPGTLGPNLTHPEEGGNDSLLTAVGDGDIPPQILHQGEGSDQGGPAPISICDIGGDVSGQAGSPDKGTKTSNNCDIGGDHTGQAGSPDRILSMETPGRRPMVEEGDPEYDGDPVVTEAQEEGGVRCQPTLIDEITNKVAQCKDWRLERLEEARSFRSVAQSGLEAKLDFLLVEAEIMTLTQADVNDLCGELTALFTKQEPGGRPRNRRRRRCVAPDRGRRKRIAFAKCQELYKKCPSKIAEVLLSGDLGELSWDPPVNKPKAEKFVELYGALWGTCGKYSGTEVEADTSSGVPFGVTPKDVKTRLKKIKKNSAKGPDGVGKADIIGVTGHANILAKFYNVILISGLYPDDWRRNRTTFIPKNGKDNSKAEHYRPITISSMISRVYSGVLDGKLRSTVAYNQRQKGFVSESGCAINCLTLDTALRLGRKKDELVMCQLDISKAFDTIPHQGLRPSLIRAGCPGAVAERVAEMYRDVTTTLGVEGSPNISLKRGVKQGDPLSPLLFNLIMDPLICDLSENFSGFPIGDQRVSVLAFADDIILLAGSVEEGQRMLNRVYEFLSGLGMALSPGKCLAGHVVPYRKTWVVGDPKLCLSETMIPGATATQIFTYLGIDFSLAQGMCNESHLDSLIVAAGRVRRLALKPRQMLRIMFTYLLPKFLYRWGVDIPAAGKLKNVDRELRMLVKQILHLHPTTTDHVFYARTRDGGLGLPRIGNALRLAGLRNGIKLLNSDDPVQRALIREEAMEWHMSRLAASFKLAWPLAETDLRRLKSLLVRQNLGDWGNLQAQGKSSQHFKDQPLSNRWLADDSLLGSWEYTNALRLRTDTAGTRVAMHRADKSLDVMCRHCRLKPESLGHVLGECIAGKGLRIDRHNEMVNLIERIATEKEFKVAKEQTFRLPDDQLLKPDLVLTNGDRALVVDVTVRFESESWFERASAEKVNKYSPLKDLICSRFDTREFEVVPIVVGSRGLVSKEVRLGLAKIGYEGRGIPLTLSLIALRTSIKIATAHMDY